MAPSTIGIIIMIVTLVLYATEVIPLVATAALSVIAMWATGLLTPAEAFSGFSNTATVLAIAAMLISLALQETGATTLLGDKLSWMNKQSKRWFNTLLCVIAAALSACLSSFAIIIIMMSVADGLVAGSNGKFTRKESYMPIAFGSSIGGAISLTGSSSILQACAVYNDYVGYDAIGFFGPAVLAIPACFGAFIFYATFGTKLCEKWFDFEEPPMAEVVKTEQAGTGKTNTKLGISVAVFVICAVLWAAGQPLAIVGWGGAIVLFIAKCIDPKTSLAKVEWNAIMILALSLGFAAGVNNSGAGEVIANFMINAAGPLGKSPVAMFTIIIILITILTNIMTNTGSAAIVAPIALAIANQMGVDARLWCIAVGVGANCAIFTPIGCANMTVILPGGYRFKDFVKPGLVVCVMSTIIMAVVFAVVS